MQTCYGVAWLFEANLQEAIEIISVHDKRQCGTAYQVTRNI